MWHSYVESGVVMRLEEGVKLDRSFNAVTETSLKMTTCPQPTTTY